jgi:hypothetical protein
MAVAGYYYFPPIWIGDTGQDLVEQIPVEVRHERVLFKELGNGIQVTVSRDGMFLFDFSRWPDDSTGRQTTVTGYDAAAEALFRRLLVLNTHVACLHWALLRQQRFVIPKMVVSPSTVVMADSLDATTLGSPDSRIRALASGGSRSFQGVGSGAAQFFEVKSESRSIGVSEAALRQSLDPLEEVLSKDFPRVAELTELYLKACRAAEEFDFSLSHTISWAICEKLLSVLWARYVDARATNDTGPKTDPKRINRDRRDTLTAGRDFTASVIGEILELADELPLDCIGNSAKHVTGAISGCTS